MNFGLRPIEGGTEFSKTVHQAEKAEALGYDSLWMAEHYTADDQWWPASLLNLSAIAAQTSTITLGTNILITPFYNPVWLASATAMLDVISEGRIVCGLGVGYDEREFQAFGVPLEDRVGRTIETTMLLKQFWTSDEVTFSGNYFEIDEFGIAPKPLQDPRPPIWFGVWGDYLLEQAGKRADAWIPGAVADMDVLAAKRAIYDDYAENPASRPLLRDIVVAESDQRAIDRAKAHLDEKYQIYADRGHQFFTDYRSDDFEAFARDRIIVGTPQSCIDQIAEYQRELERDHLIFRFSYPGMEFDETMDVMETIATEIMPSFE